MQPKPANRQKDFLPRLPTTNDSVEHFREFFVEKMRWKGSPSVISAIQG